MLSSAEAPTGAADEGARNHNPIALHSSFRQEHGAYRGRRCARLRRRLRATRLAAQKYLRRLDVCWTLVFFLLLVVIGAVTAAVSQRLILHNFLESLHYLHFFQSSVKLQYIANINAHAQQMATAVLALHRQQSPNIESAAALSSICSTLDNADLSGKLRSIIAVSVEGAKSVGCTHSVDEVASLSMLGGFMSQDHIVNSTYLVNKTTYNFVEPLQVVAEWPLGGRNFTETIPQLYSDQEIIRLAASYYNGSISSIDPQLHWMVSATMPHLIFYNLPVGLVARGGPLLPGQHASDFMQICMDGSKYLYFNLQHSPDFSSAAFVNSTLTDEYPKIFSNNWGQPSMNHNSIFTPPTGEGLIYLNTKTMDDPLMHAAIQHVDFKAMQTTGYNHSVDFEYKGAYATVTALSAVTEGGLVIPLVFVTAHSFTLPPYLTTMRICNCITVVAIVLFTALFWWFVHNEYSRPLEDMTLLLLQSVQTGRRATLRLTRRTFIQLSESAQLIRAFNDCVRRLREIDAFIPEDVRRLFLQRQQRPSLTYGATNDMSVDREMAVVRRLSRHSDTLRPHHVTMAHVTVRAWTAHAEADAAAAAAAVAGGDAVALHGGGARRGQRLAAVVERAAHAGGVANSGAFASAAAVAAFSAAVHELAAQHGGLVRSLTPDGCVVHFMAAVCAHLPRHGGAERGGGPEYDPAPLRACIDADAYAGLAFALALQRWVDARSGADTAGTAAAAAAMPDVRCLVDTGVYTCGQYRAPGSEQTLTVALGRDAQRVVGRAAALLGVRVAMTEETAVRVRPGPRAATEPGVRQLPVEALRTGRAGLDADAVILYEVLPGAAAGDAAWLAYARCCFDGFECMVRGDYAGALRAYRGVGEIGDLEPGLLPRCLSREAAHSNAVGGAVSVQVQRMMAECERRDRLQITTGYHREARSPLGIDAVLRSLSVEKRVALCKDTENWLRRRRVSGGLNTETSLPSLVTKVISRSHHLREVTLVATLKGEIRCVLGGRRERVIDNYGISWRISNSYLEGGASDPWKLQRVGLSSAGSVCLAAFVPFREVHPMITKAISDAQIGPMSDALRSAVPVQDPTAKQLRAVDVLFSGRCRLEHPNLGVFLAYSFSVEGGVVFLRGFTPGGTLREVLSRYATMTTMVTARFALGILSALAYLHSKGMVHGALSLDNVVVYEDGQCRLRGYFVDYALAYKTFLIPCTYYVSPAMAAGHAPTLACDMFCYGLLWLEGLSGMLPWTWAVDAAGRPVGTEEELRKLVLEARQPFRDAVAEGRVVAAVNNFDLPTVRRHIPGNNYVELCKCVDDDPAQRPTACMMFVSVQKLLGNYGAQVEK